jgi:hypothetical protein
MIASATVRTQSTPLRIGRNLLIGAALTLFALHFVVYGLYTASLLRFPFDYDQGEGFELYDTVLFSQFQTPYRDNNVYPFYASNYPPLYHVILVPFVWLFGPAYWYGRLVGFTASLLTALAIGWAVRRESGSTLAEWMSGLAFLASNYVYHVGPLFRQHMTMVLFETLAVVVIANYDRITSPGLRRRVILASLTFLICAGYTKQLSFSTVGAVFVFMFLREPIRAVLRGVVFAVVVGIIFLLINLSTGGQWWVNTITANVNAYLPFQYVGLLQQFIGLHGALLMLALCLFAYELYLDRISVYSVWFVASAMNSVSAGKWGAGDSYFITLIACVCVLAGIVTGRSLNRTWRWHPSVSVWVERQIGRLRLSFIIGSLAQRLTSAVALVCCALFVAYGLAVIKLPLDQPVFREIGAALNLRSNTKFAHFYDSAGWTFGYATIGQMPTDADIANGWRIVEAAKSDPRDIMSEEAAFSFHAQKPVVTNPTQLLNLYLNSAYDPSALVEKVTDQSFGVIILRNTPGGDVLQAGFYPEPVRAAIHAHYALDDTIPMNGYEYLIWRPKE